MLLGLVHGHFDVKNFNEDAVADSGLNQSINTGVGVVVPLEKIIETVEHPELVAMRKAEVARLRQDGAEPDIARTEA